MPSSKDEVNAWGSYDQVAKSARALPTRRQSVVNVIGSHSVHGSNWSIPVEPRRQSAWRSAEFADVERGERRRSAYDFALSGLDKASLLGLEDDSDDEEGGGDDNNLVEIAEEGPRLQEPEQPYEQPKTTTGVPLSEEVKKNMKDIFSVYFEGSHDAQLFKDNEREMQSKSFWSRLAMFNGTMPWLRDYIIQKVSFGPLQRTLLFTQRCLRGASQVYFQNNPLSGLFIVVGMLVQSTRVAVYGLIALVCGNLSAYILGFNRDLLNSGLFGYNAFLVGLALATFDSTDKHGGYSASALIWTVIMSSFSSIIFVSLGKLLVPYKSPPLTFPFNIATLLFLIATAEMTRVQVGPVREPSLPDYSDTGEANGQLTARAFFAGVIRGIGQVYLADNIVSGVLVLVGIAICSRIAAIAALVGSALGAAVAVATGVSASAIEYGFYGFNSSLSVTAMYMFYVPSFGASIMGTLAAILTVVSQQALAGLLKPFGLPFLTLPFCVVALPLIILQGTTSIVIAVPLASMTIPEDHLKRIQMLADGYQFLKDAIHREREKSKYGKGISRTLRRLSTTISSEFTTESRSTTSFWSFPSIPSSCSNYCCVTTSDTVHDKEEWVEEAASSIFDTLDETDTGTLDLQKFTDALRSSGLAEETGLQFAALVFELMNSGQTNKITRRNFIAFCLVSRTLLGIHRKIEQFVDFVNVQGDEYVGVDELESAQEYLGQPALTRDEQRELLVLNGQACNEGACLDIVELVNFVTVAYVKTLVEEYRGGNSERTDSTS